MLFKRYINTISLFLHAFENWFFAMSEEHRLREFQNRVLRKLFVPQRNEVTDVWMDSTMLSIVTSTPHLTVFGPTNQEK
jgi:hypothetical protein